MKATKAERLTIELEGDEVKAFREVLRKADAANKAVGFCGERLNDEERKLLDELRVQ